MTPRPGILQRIETAFARALLRLPDGLLYALSGGARTNAAGERMDARVQLALLLARIKPKLESLPPQLARAQMRALVETLDAPPLELARVEQISIPGTAKFARRIPMRVYAPDAIREDLPALVYFHGGGFVIGDLDSYDSMLRYVSKTAGCAVVSVDYRLAQEHPFPAGIEDACATYGWILKHGALLGIDPQRVAVGGDSAGASMALNVCLQSGPRRFRIPRFHASIYPWIDLSESQHEDESIREFEVGYVLDRSLIDYFTRHTCLATQKLEDPLVSPIYASSQSLSRVPPGLIQVCGFDPLRDQGLRMAEALRAAGSECEVRRYPDLVHGATGMRGVCPSADQMITDYAETVAALFASANATGGTGLKKPRAKQGAQSSRPSKKATKAQ